MVVVLSRILLYTNESASFYQPTINTLRTTNTPIQSTIQLQLPTAPKTRIKPTYLVNFDSLADKSYLMSDTQVLEADREIKLIFDKIRLFTTKQTIHLRGLRTKWRGFELRQLAVTAADQPRGVLYHVIYTNQEVAHLALPSTVHEELLGVIHNPFKRRATTPPASNTSRNIREQLSQTALQCLETVFGEHFTHVASTTPELLIDLSELSDIDQHAAPLAHTRQYIELFKKHGMLS